LIVTKLHIEKKICKTNRLIPLNNIVYNSKLRRNGLLMLTRLLASISELLFAQIFKHNYRQLERYTPERSKNVHRKEFGFQTVSS